MPLEIEPATSDVVVAVQSAIATRSATAWQRQRSREGRSEDKPPETVLRLISVRDAFYLYRLQLI
jgi:hypothetical protein